MAYKAINFQGKVTFSPKLYQTYLRYSANYTSHFPLRNISSSTKAELELNLTEKSDVTHHVVFARRQSTAERP